MALSTAVIDDPSGPGENGPEGQRDASYTLIQTIRGSSFSETHYENGVLKNDLANQKQMDC